MSLGNEERRPRQEGGAPRSERTNYTAQATTRDASVLLESASSRLASEQAERLLAAVLDGARADGDVAADLVAVQMWRLLDRRLPAALTRLSANRRRVAQHRRRERELRAVRA